MIINRQEILRYLGYGRNIPDERTDILIDECIEEVMQVMECRSTYRRFPLEICGKGLMRVCGIEFHSENLAKNLRDCEEVIFMAATLGPGPDRLMNRYQKLHISKAAVLQATAAAAIESYCNELQSEIADDLSGENLFLRPRFSPGYGDLSLNVQADFLGMLDAAKQAGIVLSDGGVMIPEKSVTAVIGISRTNESCHMDGCESCEKINCAYRRQS